jgi:RNA ligase
MNYEFPIINNISDVLSAIEGRDEFVVAVKEGYTVINYNVMMADTFPDVLNSSDLRANHDHYEIENLHARLRRECRGIIFDTATGEIIRRPFHKFFNVNEREETQDRVVDLTRPHAILEKLDGSMIAPFIVNGEMIWGTKMGATDVAQPVEEFVKNNPQYEQLAMHLLPGKLTPIFEWCSRKQRIVMDYPEDQLVLTAVRHMNTGAYVSYNVMKYLTESLAGIPLVRQWDISMQMDNKTMSSFVSYVRDLEDREGFVVRFDDGHMLKLKCDWYVQIHKAKEAILQDRNIVELILDNNLDDVKAHLPQEDRDRLTRFEIQFNLAVSDIVFMLDNDLNWLREQNIDRKTFALEYAEKYDQYMRALIFKNFDELNLVKYWDDVRNTIRKNLTKTVKYEEIRDVWFKGVTYNA